MSSAFLILNETTFRGTDQVATEPVSLHATLQGAMDCLHDLATEHDVFVEDDADSVYLPPQFDHILSDEYYIVEMELND